MVDKLPFRLAALAVAAYFLYFVTGAIHAGFAVDDPMNLGFYWLRGFWYSAFDDVKFWSTAYRPMGAMFYMPIFHVFGMNPVPYRIAVFALLAANMHFSFRITELLTKSRAAGLLTAVMVCAHGTMAAIIFNTSMIYDILAFFFMTLMRVLYMRFRQSGNNLSIAQMAVVIVAFIAGARFEGAGGGGVGMGARV